MPVIIRDARLDDAPACLEIKRELHLSNLEPQRGGFLLGTTLEGYEALIGQDHVIVAEDAGRVLGFVILLGQENLMRSDLWARASKAKLTLPVEHVLARGRIAYVEQLAMRPAFSSRVYAKYLAYHSLQRAFQDHATVFTTVVREPVNNDAILPFLEVAGFASVGSIEEDYPDVGQIRSEIFALSSQVFQASLQQANFQLFLRKGQRDGFI
jgi:ribosomal protein S18 acetylase RimI-like enzyme